MFGNFTFNDCITLIYLISLYFLKFYFSRYLLWAWLIVLSNSCSRTEWDFRNSSKVWSLQL